VDEAFLGPGAGGEVAVGRALGIQHGGHVVGQPFAMNAAGRREQPVEIRPLRQE
jgi:hypothetical protein